MPPVILRWGRLSASIRPRIVPGGRGKSVVVYVVSCGGVVQQFDRYAAAEQYAKRMIRPTLSR